LLLSCRGFDKKPESRIVITESDSGTEFASHRDEYTSPSFDGMESRPWLSSLHRFLKNLSRNFSVKVTVFSRLILLTKKRAVGGRYLSMEENDFSAVSSTILASKRYLPKEQGKDAYRWME
jgi:hypothetical protein